MMKAGDSKRYSFYYYYNFINSICDTHFLEEVLHIPKKKFCSHFETDCCRFVASQKQKLKHEDLSKYIKKRRRYLKLCNNLIITQRCFRIHKSSQGV